MLIQNLKSLQILQPMDPIHTKNIIVPLRWVTVWSSDKFVFSRNNKIVYYVWSLSEERLPQSCL